MKSLLFVLFTAASFAVDSFGQTVINSVPYHITSPGTYVLGANPDVASGNVISGFKGGILSGGNSYLFENILNNCDTGLFMQASDKYRFNTTFNCTTPFNGGTAVTSENN